MPPGVKTGYVAALVLGAAAAVSPVASVALCFLAGLALAGAATIHVLLRTLGRAPVPQRGSAKGRRKPSAAKPRPKGAKSAARTPAKRGTGKRPRRATAS